MRYRVAVLDSPDGAIIGEVRDERARLDSKYGALYYPWVRAFDPISENELAFPPSGYISGIYARNDVERGVHKAPANEVIRLATGFETLVNKGQQEVLNPLGVNCLRFFEGRGFRVWGARGITSDGEWKYINLRRNFAYIGRSIEIGTQWAVFEPNGEELWANVRRSVEDFLYNEWKSSRLMGTTPEEAFFVRCDRTTMTQSNIDNGQLIALVGVSLFKPAEFVIFRIGQKTLDFKG
jgi:phage tail sheath protein FI